MTRTALYRHYDAEGQLLYVGISDCLSERDKQHAATSHWHARVSKTTTIWYDTRLDALAAEREAIRHEKPMHNIQNVAREVCDPVEQGVFRRGFMAAMASSGAGISEIAAGSGVSRDVINKLIARPGSSTSVENSVALAAYFQTTVDDLMDPEPSESAA